MPLNFAVGAFAGAIGAIVGGGASAFSSWRAGQPVRWRDVAAGAAGGATAGFIGGSTFGLGLLPMVAGGEAGAIAGLAVTSLIRWRRPTGTEVAATAVAGLVAAGALGYLQPLSKTVPRMIATGAVAGAGANGASQVTANVLDRRPILENVGESTLLGGATGAGTMVLAMSAAKTLDVVTRKPEPPPPPPEPRPASRGMVGMLANGRVLSDTEIYVLSTFDRHIFNPEVKAVRTAIQQGKLDFRLNDRGSNALKPDPVNKLVLEVRPDEMSAPQIFHDAYMRGSTKLKLQQLFGEDAGPTPPPAGATPAELAARARAFERLELAGTDDAIKVWNALRENRLVLRVGRPADEILAPGQLRVDDPILLIGEYNGIREFLGRALAVLKQSELDARPR